MSGERSCGDGGRPAVASKDCYWPERCRDFGECLNAKAELGNYPCLRGKPCADPRKCDMPLCRADRPEDVQ